VLLRHFDGQSAALAVVGLGILVHSRHRNAFIGSRLAIIEAVAVTAAAGWEPAARPDYERSAVDASAGSTEATFAISSAR
jgi:hypothetical protein